MEVYTDAPGVQLYTANGLSGVSGKGGVSYGRRGAFCFETQFYPDSANKAQFPTIILKAGDGACEPDRVSVLCGKITRKARLMLEGSRI